MKEALELKEVALVGRTFDEYFRFFKLNELNTRNLKILDVGSGVSSFCCEANRKGIRAFGTDPLYVFDRDRIATDCQSHLAEVVRQLPALKHKYNWKVYKDIPAFAAHRQKAYELFLADYAVNRERYFEQQLPATKFRDQEFSIALVSYLLFMYDDRFTYEFHKKSIEELLRITTDEVRIHPLVNLKGERSPFVDQLMQDADFKKFKFEIKKVDYEWLINSNETLVIRHK